MKRRDFIKNILTASAATYGDPVAMLRAGAGLQEPPNSNSIDPIPPYSPVQVAHIESELRPKSIDDLYINHAEVARIIHDHVADSLSGMDIPVNHLNISGINPTAEELEQIQDLDVYSVSQGLNQLNIGIGSSAKLYEKYWEEGDAIGVYSAGNQGETKIVVPKQALSDFSDTAVTVGEAGKRIDGAWQVKEHSQKVGNVSFLAPNITDEVLKVPIINQSPNLTGHGELVRTSEVWLDVRAALEVEGYGKEVSHKILSQKRDELLANSDYVRELDNKVNGYLTDDPSPFHQKMIERIAQLYPMDANGLSSHVDGTSFCSPYVAGAFSAAKAESKIRETQDKPSLSSEELVALSYLSCDSVIHQEGERDIESKENNRGLASNNRAGFGVFTAENFAIQKKEAYQRLDKNPELASIPRKVGSNNFVPEKDGTGGFVISIPEDDDITILKTRVEYHSEDIPPVTIKLTSPQGYEQYLDMSQGVDGSRKDGSYQYSWGNTEQLFGEASAGEWKVEPIFDSPDEKSKWRINPTDLKITIHGVEKGGLIDQMIDKKLGVEKEHSIDQDQSIPVPPVQNNKGGGRGK